MSQFDANPVSALLPKRLIGKTPPHEIYLVIIVDRLHHMLGKHDLHLPLVLSHVARGFYIVVLLPPAIIKEHL